MRVAAIFACLALTATAAPALAANANNPYGNVDHRNDAGNDTGDAQTDRLNDAQLTGGSAPAWQQRQRRFAPAPGAYAAGGYPPRAYSSYSSGGYPPAAYPPPPYGYPPPMYAPPGYPPPGYMQPPPGYPYTR